MSLQHSTQKLNSYELKSLKYNNSGKVRKHCTALNTLTDAYITYDIFRCIVLSDSKHNVVYC